MIDLKKLRESAEQLPKDFSSTSFWFNAGEAIELLDMLEAALQDSKRIDFIEKNAVSLSNDCDLWEIMVNDSGDVWYTDEKTVRQVVDAAILEKA